MEVTSNSAASSSTSRIVSSKLAETSRPTPTASVRHNPTLPAAIALSVAWGREGCCCGVLLVLGGVGGASLHASIPRALVLYLAPVPDYCSAPSDDSSELFQSMLRRACLSS